MRGEIKFAAGSIFIGLLGLGLKYYAYVVTGSLALYSDALESIANVVASISMMIAVSLSLKPADSNHHYGHHKAEYFSALFEGIIIFEAAFAILYKLFNWVESDAAPLLAPSTGILLNGSATLINTLWGIIMIRYGRMKRSPALEADGKHLLSDGIGSIGILIGVALVYITGLKILDPIIAAIMAAYLMWMGTHVIKESVSGLMDAAPTDIEVSVIKKLIKANYKNSLQAHDLRVRRAGQMLFVDFHLVVDGKMTVNESHGICDLIETAIKTQFTNALISIHIEPDNKIKADSSAIIL
jgi:cation diffusion facilitator family transporter